MSRLTPLPRGLYAITSAVICTDDHRLIAAVEAVIRGGAALLQYRDKHADAATRHRRATRLQACCSRAGCALIINDDVALALAVGAQGVHIGKGDGDAETARRLLGSDPWVGVTCGDSMARAEAAVAAGADYVAFGRLFPSRTKPDAPPATLDTVTRAARTLPVAVCAIGGIGLEHLHSVATTGASLVAVVDGVFGDPDPRVIESRARAYAARWSTYNPDTSPRA